MKPQALILIDYTMDFVADDGALTAGKPAQAIDGSICNGIADMLDSGGFVFVMNDMHLADDPTHPESALFPPHNIKGTPGRDIFGKTGEYLEKRKDLVDKKIFWMDKMRYSSFCGTPLDQMLRARGISEIELCGVCTDICVLHTAVDAYNFGYHALIRKDRVASFNPDGHEWALGHFKNSLGFEVV